MDFEPSPEQREIVRSLRAFIERAQEGVGERGVRAQASLALGQKLIDLIVIAYGFIDLGIRSTAIGAKPD